MGNQNESTKMSRWERKRERRSKSTHRNGSCIIHYTRGWQRESVHPSGRSHFGTPGGQRLLAMGKLLRPQRGGGGDAYDDAVRTCSESSWIPARALLTATRREERRTLTALIMEGEFSLSDGRSLVRKRTYSTIVLCR